ncbi:hypothetical protein EGR_07025 [Echinococcus granulosus]|uniref:Uncharacterized protein n=1 Tax=Echinococcus granulosus TaxID=6210 RepID=W6UAK0_ECHGR|nr:hypothetical protein EGR_07025 [Echinococcus granulosus]EUB58105.1 hypothetical protein EGR_07025 [Echinococcus granulosus]
MMQNKESYPFSIKKSCQDIRSPRCCANAITMLSFCCNLHCNHRLVFTCSWHKSVLTNTHPKRILTSEHLLKACRFYVCSKWQCNYHKIMRIRRIWRFIHKVKPFISPSSFHFFNGVTFSAHLSTHPSDLTRPSNSHTLSPSNNSVSFVFEIVFIEDYSCLHFLSFCCLSITV